MGANPKPGNLQAGALLCIMFWAACTLGQTVRHHQQKVDIDAAFQQVTEAEAAIEKQDYVTAERLLVQVVRANPKDALAWYDLGYIYKATQRPEQAIDAYRKSV